MPEAARTVRIRRSNAAAAVTGLLVAWGGAAVLVSPVGRPLSDPSRLGLALAAEALLWALAGTLVAGVLFWEKLPLESMWLRPFHWRSIAWGLLLAGVYYAILFPLGEWVRRTAGMPGFAGGMEQMMRFPLWYRIAAAVSAGVVEEVLFRGYSVTRLATLTGRIWLAAAIALVGFCALHAPLWGWGFVLSALVSGAGAMAFFVWRKDLLAMMVFHATTDIVGLVLAPLFSEWWKATAMF
ncbi:MAG TPA: CPBP family intramembrane glutamic endopeptidase [Bryobacteraceae bacterium]|jgi:membrane protease YdiL (CAAX protease family)